jgi:hypothetical protein
VYLNYSHCMLCVLCMYSIVCLFAIWYVVDMILYRIYWKLFKSTLIFIADDPLSVCSHHACCTCNQPSMSSTTTHEISEHSLDSISCSSDYERQSLDFERHSSEEELSTIHKELASEKRKWSQVHSVSCDSTGSVDEEVKELMLEPQPIMFSSSPPKDDSDCTISFDHNNEHSCDGTIQLIVGPESQNSNFRSENPHDIVLTKENKMYKTFTPHSRLSFPKGPIPALISPRKRHRKISVSESGNEHQSSAVRRPSLDFEKMQVCLNILFHYWLLLIAEMMVPYARATFKLISNNRILQLRVCTEN